MRPLIIVLAAAAAVCLFIVKFALSRGIHQAGRPRDAIRPRSTGTFGFLQNKIMISSPKSPFGRVITGFAMLLYFSGMALAGYFGVVAGGRAGALVDVAIGLTIFVAVIVAVTRSR